MRELRQSEGRGVRFRLGENTHRTVTKDPTNGYGRSRASAGGGSGSAGAPVPLPRRILPRGNEARVRAAGNPGIGREIALSGEAAVDDAGDAGGDRATYAVIAG